MILGVGPGLWPADLEGHKHSDPLLQLARSLLCRPWDITPQVTNRRSTVIRHFHSTTHSPARCTLCYLDWSKYALTLTPHFYNPHFVVMTPFPQPLLPHSIIPWPHKVESCGPYYIRRLDCRFVPISFIPLLFRLRFLSSLWWIRMTWYINYIT